MWEDLFRGRSQKALTSLVFDHTPIVLEWGWRKGGPSPFKFEETWFLEPDFMELVESVLSQSHYSGNASRIIALKLKNLKFRLKAWS